MLQFNTTPRSHFYLKTLVYTTVDSDGKYKGVMCVRNVWIMKVGTLLEVDDKHSGYHSRCLYLHANLTTTCVFGK